MRLTFRKKRINRVIRSQSTNSKIVKPYGPDKCPILLKLPYIGVESKLIEKKIMDITSKTYHAVNPRVLFTQNQYFNVREKT